MLNKLNNKRNPIIITYSEALSEKVVSRRELKRQTIIIKIGDLHEIEELEEQLLSHHFEKVDFVASVFCIALTMVCAFLFFCG